ncbi:hypothetical protein EG68_00565 [Paragonimus skrjabini miyazakii]|uniref:Uncharacterized protein n=1 Tax=Paragonimus skrjabini miyazakii TaxID=59628 RepID=A0A8S9Z688_9TREM|nr:hypothetical protein EG68_00565 [Paragonimus skrjabini miyazakii]
MKPPCSHRCEISGRQQIRHTVQEQVHSSACVRISTPLCEFNNMKLVRIRPLPLVGNLYKYTNKIGRNLLHCFVFNRWEYHIHRYMIDFLLVNKNRDIQQIV